ncbi:PGRS family protein [Sorangium cellulosum]|uniref:PGRS family protein n=1 Tax=Sorangium cellulosum TaxID=56 RepID=UPI0013314F1F|nr:PGRS family protein [Sorangium cellulosum]
MFVSAGRGSAEGSGTKDAPLSSLQEAVALAQQNGTGRVYACAGDGEAFNEAVDVPSGVTIYGGFDCGNKWLWVGDTTKTTLTAEPGAIPLTMHGVPGIVHIEDMHIVAQPGGQQTNETVSSIAAIALSTNVELVRCMLEAGDAAPGANGALHASAAGVGPAGRAGENACSSPDGADVAGGGVVRNDCGTPDDPSDDSVGGKGGNGSISEGYNGTSGEPVIPADGDEPNGGAGHVRNSVNPCTPGVEGNSRDAGMPGADATGRGAISAAGYAGVGGIAGGRGMSGQGGGGGGGERGASPASTRRCPGGVDNRAGAGGGSGGPGGCGGAGGRGGLPGGASIALVSIDAALSFNAVILKSANGGDGGDGGDGQQGGAGGAGGPGGTVPTGSEGISAGCPGGAGGRGGDGGKGGGGQGGHSLGIAFLGQQPPTEGATVFHGTAGRGGTGGSPDRRGADGVAMDMLGFD